MPEHACVRCGCTQEKACAGGCAWVEVTKDGGLCSACVPSVASILRIADEAVVNARKMTELAETLKDARGAEMLGYLVAGQAAAFATNASQLRALAAIAARLGPLVDARGDMDDYGWRCA